MNTEPGPADGRRTERIPFPHAGQAEHSSQSLRHACPAIVRDLYPVTVWDRIRLRAAARNTR